MTSITAIENQNPHRMQCGIRWCALILFFIITFPCSSQNIYIHEIRTLDQLPVNAIHRIFQDKEGYLWYGTVDGLCRDDGYNVCVFRSDMNTPGIIDDNLILCINEDKEGNIWFGTSKGAYILNKKTYTISRLDNKRLRGQFIYRIDDTADGTMWVSVLGHLLHYNDDGRLIKSYPACENGVNKIIGGFCQGSKGEIILTYFKGGIYYIDKRFDAIKNFPGKIQNCAAIIKDNKHDYYWLMTWGNGIIRFNPKASSLKEMYVSQPLPLTTMDERDPVILYPVQDNTLGYLWVTTKKDIIAYSQDALGMLHQVNLGSAISKSNKMLNDIIMDRRGNLWVSAFDRPSFTISFPENKPKDYELPSLRNYMNYSPAIMAMADAGDNVLWLSQERVGLFLYDLNSDAASFFNSFPTLRNHSLDEIRVTTPSKTDHGIWVAPDNDKNIYKVTRNGMKMNLEKTINMPTYIDAGSVKSIVESSSKQFLWIGTTSGLFRYDIKCGRLSHISANCGAIIALAEDANKNVWFCSGDKGLFRFSPDGRIKHLYKKCGISAISLSNDGNVWIGSQYGQLFMFDPCKKTMTDYSKECNLYGNQINQIVVDMYNHVWIDNNSKITEFNPHNGSYQTYLTSDHSILLWRILPSALCRLSDGRICVGGIPGITIFTPSARLEKDAEPVKTTITNVKLMGHSLFFNSDWNTKPSDIITIDHNARDLVIEFSTLNQRFAYKTRYAYRLKGVDKDWIYTPDGHNSALYNHLSKGTYTFEVKATDENGLWSNRITSIKIERLPAFYETWWAFLIYTLMAISTASYAILTYVKRAKNKNEELWADSKEMIEMRNYLDERQELPKNESVRLDKMFLDKAIKAVNDNISESDFDVNKLAEGMNMSRSTLTRKLKTITGQTPLEFIRSIKLKRACILLLERNKNISEIASYLGYYDRKYFTACFKEEYDMTPSEYQKKHS